VKKKEKKKEKRSSVDGLGPRAWLAAKT